MKQNDYELVYLAQEGNEDAINLIYQKYTPIIIKKSKDAILRATHHGIEISDIMQEGYIALDDAIKSFSSDMDASFYTFALLCIDRQIVNYMRRTVSNKGKVLNEALGIDDDLERVIRDKTNIEHNLMVEEQLKMLAEQVRPTLTKFEKKVFDLMLDNESFEDIAKILNKDVKAIYNTFQRIKLKIRKNVKIDG